MVSLAPYYAEGLDALSPNFGDRAAFGFGRWNKSNQSVVTGENESEIFDNFDMALGTKWQERIINLIKDGQAEAALELFQSKLANINLQDADTVKAVQAIAYNMAWELEINADYEALGGLFGVMHTLGIEFDGDDSAKYAALEENSRQEYYSKERDRIIASTPDEEIIPTLQLAGLK